VSHERPASGARTVANPQAARARTSVAIVTAARTASERVRVADPHIRAAVAVIMTRFPRIEDTFILREINELERNGQPVLVVPLIRAESTVIHEEAKPWVRRALFTPFLSKAIVLDNLRVFFRQPLRYLRLLGTLILGTLIRPSTLLRTLALFPKSVHLSAVLTQRGIRHVHSHFATHATTMAYIIASLSDITYSFTVHGPDVFVHRLLVREKVRKARFIRAVSTFNKAFLCGLFPEETEGKVEVIRSGVDPDVYADAASEAEAEVETKKRPVIISVSELTPHRGFPYLVDACARLIRAGMDVECRIVGGGPLFAATEQWIAEHDLIGKVCLLGVQPQHEVARLMGESDLFVLPSIIANDGQMDGIPVSLMEAMAAGKPVIAASISGIPELVRHDVSGLLVDAAHPERVAQAITRLLRDPELRRRMGRAGQEKVRKDFDVRRNIKSLIALLDAVETHVDPGDTTFERVASLNWTRLQVAAVGVRRVQEQGDVHVTEVTISDGVNKRDVIVRQPRLDDDEDVSPLVRARNEFEVISMLRQSMEPAPPVNGTHYSVPRLLMFDEPNATVVVERADGKSLGGLVRAARSSGRVSRLTNPLRKAGAWLRAMQEHTAGPEDGRNVLTAVIFLALRDLDLACGADRSLLRRRSTIAERLRELETRLADRGVRVTGQHGDYRPDNIYIGDRRVDVTGFVHFREGLPLEDVARFLIALELRFDLPLLRRHLKKMRAAFVEGYVREGDAGAVDDEALQLFTITKALEMLAHGGISSPRMRRALTRIITRSC
jgi:colanic acid/amylovoran biosynthesis glycosyltransferase